MKFKEGQRVRLVKHGTDSEPNLQIGVWGTILDVYSGGEQPLLVKWDVAEILEDWWVEESIVAPLKMQMTNK